MLSCKGKGVFSDHHVCILIGSFSDLSWVVLSVRKCIRVFLIHPHPRAFSLHQSDWGTDCRSFRNVPVIFCARIFIYTVIKIIDTVIFGLPFIQVYFLSGSGHSFLQYDSDDLLQSSLWRSVVLKTLAISPFWSECPWVPFWMSSFLFPPSTPLCLRMPTGAFLDVLV